ncbi:UDP-glycosyltransferase UGT5-like [Leptidea sinapis]|uniref:UDP-glycosyltransferase UGT5-like n=1 Tax=Leptidea sinapis TaxID=189913 RepID=UPI0021C387A7|nr:UDP-glycosyltransferase UGT5-like [Leptidea sinapis]
MQLFTEEIRDLVTDNESAKFDLLLLEMCARASLIYSYLFDAPVIQISSFGMWTDIDKTIGAPTHPLLFPNLFHQKLYDLSFWEKLYEIYKDWIIKYNSLILESIEMRDVLNLFGNQIPNYDILRKNVHMLSINSHPIWYDSQPLPLNLISMWGIHNKTQKILPQYDVLWKWDNDNFPILSGNIKMSKWFPQSDILRHPNVKLFISQGGLQSIEEAVHAGVPVIGIPMFIDQWYNVEKIRHHKIGIRLDMDTLDQQKLNESIHTVLNDARFQNNILRFRSLLSDQPHSGLDRAVWWTEYVLHHGGAKHLEAPSAHISWVEYYDVQLISTLIRVSVSFIVIIYCFIAKNFSFMLFSD